MCGRTKFDDLTVEQVASIMRAVRGIEKWRDRINHAPTMDGPVIRIRQGERRLEAMRWGLSVPWSNAPVINAQSETVRKKPTFSLAVEQQRCLIISSGFYEWEADKKPKQPWLFELPDNAPLVMAGIWTSGRDSHGQPSEGYCVLTTAANAYLKRCHDRMPVILPQSSWEAWLDPGGESEQLQRLWVPWSGPMLARPVTTALNRVSYQDGPLEIEVKPSNSDEPVQGELF